jgi:ADP-L-glycero-D-manno-heptose 6-epimerase
VLSYHSAHHQKQGILKYTHFPENLKGAYQSFTQADVTHLHSTGYTKAFQTVEEGVHAYLTWLDTQ